MRIGACGKSGSSWQSHGLVRPGDGTEGVFRFTRAHQAEFHVATMARVLGVFSSGFYAWLRRRRSARSLSDDGLVRQVPEIHRRSRGTYGASRIHAELVDSGVRVGRKRIARLMREAGLAGVSRRKGPRTTRRGPQARPAPDLVNRRLTADARDRLWLADITYVATGQGFLYLAIVLDAFSRRCREAGVLPSMGRARECFDNAMAERFSASLECELIDRTRFRDQGDAKRELFRDIEGGYNTHRRHSGIGHRSPVNFEKTYREAA